MLDFHGRQRQPLTIRIYRGADAKRAGIVCLDENDMSLILRKNRKSRSLTLGPVVSILLITEFLTITQNR